MSQKQQQNQGYLDPILSLPIPSPASSLCFVSVGHTISSSDVLDDQNPIFRGNGKDRSHDDDDDQSNSIDDESDDEEIVFRSTSLIQDDGIRTTQDDSDLDGRLLVTCHHNGDALLWDLKLQKHSSIISTDQSSQSIHAFSSSGSSSHHHHHRGPGLVVRRTHNPSRFLYQTRGDRGVVSLHSVDRLDTSGNFNVATTSVIRQYETFSSGFCQVAPCYGNEHYAAMPTEFDTAQNHPKEDTNVILVDHRVKDPVARISIPDGKNHGMLISIGLTVGGSTPNNKAVNDLNEDKIYNGSGSDRLILACGMESGTGVFYDLAMPSHPIGETVAVNQGHTQPPSTYSFAKEPILSMDLFPSTTHLSATKELSSEDDPSHSRPPVSAIVAAGLAGDSAEVESLDKADSGRVVLVKATTSSSSRDPELMVKDQSTPRIVDDYDSSPFQFQHRARISTIPVERCTKVGKPGVAICRFRPNDGNLLAVGGWDRRVRLFDRSHGKLMAILKGHNGSVSSFDWASDADKSGLLASSGSDTKVINIWKCFAGKS